MNGSLKNHANCSTGIRPRKDRQKKWGQRSGKWCWDGACTSAAKIMPSYSSTIPCPLTSALTPPSYPWTTLSPLYLHQHSIQEVIVHTWGNLFQRPWNKQQQHNFWNSSVAFEAADHEIHHHNRLPVESEYTTKDSTMCWLFSQHRSWNLDIQLSFHTLVHQWFRMHLIAFLFLNLKCLAFKKGHPLNCTSPLGFGWQN